MVTANKEYDPAMHTAEHILNQTMVRMFSCGRAFSAHIEKKKSKCDYRYNRQLTGEELIFLEEQVNNIIKEDLIVSESFFNRNDAENKFNLDRLPDNSGDIVRVISVGDYDACPCSGVHVKRTSEIGSFKIISTDFNDGVLRVRFKVTRPDGP